MQHSTKILLLVVAVLAFSAGIAIAQQNYDTVQVVSQKVSGNIYMLTGAGGNMGLCAGDEGGFLVDAEYAPMTEKIKAAVGEINPKPIQYLFNTHVHGDHVGGNENFAKTGVVIVGHDNIRKRMSAEQYIELFKRKTPPYPALALPAITYSDEINFHMNGENIHIFHLPNAHTDGDGVVQFVKANVISTGDLFFNGLYPIIDLSSGGSIDGMIAAVEKILSVTNDETKIIPGHGPLTNPARLREYKEMLSNVRENIEKLLKNGKSLEETIAAKPTKDYDEVWGKSFITPDMFVTMVYKSLTQK
jgi:glyoxylase-like metal-dependent hydrolase (beta-lactamase superfamily II)